LNTFQLIVLSIVQGITEWLPISSSGHLAIIQHLFHLNVPVIFDILLHFGTIIAVLVFFKKEIAGIIGAIFKLDFRSEYGRLVIYIIIASIPTAIIGFLFKDFFESLFYNQPAIGIALLLTGFILFFSSRKRGSKEISSWSAIVTGIVQGLAIIPGISRTGATLSSGLFFGIDREKAARFSLLLSIPAILGASVIDFNYKEIASIGVTNAIMGIIISAIVGFFAIKLLVNVLKNHKFHLFAYYCWIVGLLTILFVK